ncbi:hypothetical protein RB195_003230 [Necator americanus]|uniref:Peroxisomal biogenesis factor 3 n=1 Tax=Necator americanus TaxID=51031 RepID=A0ABR1DML5_NECAM
MSGTWEFIKRHKGKIIAGGVLIGGATAYMLQMKQQSHTSLVPNHYSPDSLQVKVKRRYIFDTNQRACDQSISDLVKDLKTRVQLRFDVESLITKLKEDVTLSVEEKVELWNHVKVLNLNLGSRRLLSSLKAQIISYFDLDASYPSSPLELSESDNSSAVAGSRKIFVQCTQYFLTTGTLKLLQLVEETCKDVSSTLLLTDQVNSDRMREVFEAADQIISKKVPTFFSALVAPLTESEKCSSDPVMQLLTRLVKSLESEKCRETLSTLIDFYLTAAVHKLPSEPAALAKLLPSFLDIFDFVASDAYDSPLQNSLCSSDIYHYANFVFKTL